MAITEEMLDKLVNGACIAELWELINAEDAKLADVIATCPKIAIGTYTGNDKHGSSNPNKLTFDFEPKFLMVWGYSSYILLAIKGQKARIIHESGFIEQTSTTWGSNYVSWYHTAGYTQMNQNGSVFGYIAIG